MLNMKNVEFSLWIYKKASRIKQKVANEWNELKILVRA